jgi:putrescine importer
LALLIPLAGLLIDLFIWLNLSHSAQLLGILWIAAGLALYLVMRRSGTGADTSELKFESN